MRPEGRRGPGSGDGQGRSALPGASRPQGEQGLRGEKGDSGVPGEPVSAPQPAPRDRTPQGPAAAGPTCTVHPPGAQLNLMWPLPPPPGPQGRPLARGSSTHSVCPRPAPSTWDRGDDLAHGRLVSLQGPQGRPGAPGPPGLTGLPVRKPSLCHLAQARDAHSPFCPSGALAPLVLPVCHFGNARQGAPAQALLGP